MADAELFVSFSGGEGGGKTLRPVFPKQEFHITEAFIWRVWVCQVDGALGRERERDDNV